MSDELYVGFVSEATYSCSFLGVFGFDDCVGAVLRRVNDKFVWLTS
jgi:hypothetical protein